MKCVPKSKRQKDEELDEALDESFPASDPPNLTPKPECDDKPSGPDHPTPRQK